ncbi:alanine dehydrogenase, partial [Mesorhizobium sp. M0913]
MRIGCPREIKNHEYRVGLTPGSVREYVAHGHEVLIETGAGAGLGPPPPPRSGPGAPGAPTAARACCQTRLLSGLEEAAP